MRIRTNLSLLDRKFSRSTGRSINYYYVSNSNKHVNKKDGEQMIIRPYYSGFCLLIVVEPMFNF